MQCVIHTGNTICYKAMSHNNLPNNFYSIYSIKKKGKKIISTKYSLKLTKIWSPNINYLFIFTVDVCADHISLMRIVSAHTNIFVCL